MKNKAAILFIFLNGLWAFAAGQVHHQDISGKWIAVKPYDDTIMELEIDKAGNFVEIVKDAKTNKIQSRSRSTYKIIKDSLIRFGGGSARKQYHLVKLVKGNLSFSSLETEAQVDIPLLYLYTFIRNKAR